MAGSVKDYDPKEIVITWIPVPAPGITPGAINLGRGIAEGTFVTIARDAQLNTKRIGGDGEGTRIRSHNRGGTVTVTLRNGSDVHDDISKVLEVYEATGLGAFGPLSVKDFSGRSLYTSPVAYPQGWPAKSNSAGSEDDLVWVFDCHDLVMFHGGNAEVS